MVLLEMYLEEFTKNFRPTFREQDHLTICFNHGEEVLEKDEETGIINWKKAYPEQIKKFILQEVQRLLLPKFIPATFMVASQKIIAVVPPGVSVELSTHQDLLLTLLALEVESIEGRLIRHMNQPYEFRAVKVHKDNGFTREQALELVLEAIAIRMPQVIIKKAEEKS